MKRRQQRDATESDETEWSSQKCIRIFLIVFVLFWIWLAMEQFGYVRITRFIPSIHQSYIDHNTSSSAEPSEKEPTTPIWEQFENGRYSLESFQKEWKDVEAVLQPIERQMLINNVMQFDRLSFDHHCTYLEWGSGGSTRLINEAISTNGAMVSIEHVTQWCQIMMQSQHFKIALAMRKFSYICVQHNFTLGGWGRPRTEDAAVLGQLYVNGGYANALQKLQSSLSDFRNVEQINMDTIDVVFIDGRYRVACALKILLENTIRCEDKGALPKSIVMMHDYIDQRRYNFIEKYYDVVTNASTLVVLKCQQTFAQMNKDTQTELLKDIKLYSNNFE